MFCSDTADCSNVTWTTSCFCAVRVVFWMRLRYFTGSLAEFLNLVIKVTRTDLMRLAPLLIRKSTQAALMNQRKPLHALIMTRFRQIWNPGCYSSLTVFSPQYTNITLYADIFNNSICFTQLRLKPLQWPPAYPVSVVCQFVYIMTSSPWCNEPKRNSLIPLLYIYGHFSVNYIYMI